VAPADVPVAVGFVTILGYLLHAFYVRLRYPFDLEWIEGGMLVEALRLRQGLPLYVEPGADFIPSIYPPLYPWLVGLLGEPSYALGRGVSIAGTLAAIVALILLLRTERFGWGLALGAGGLFIGCYDDVGTFFDIARSDALGFGLVALALFASRAKSVPRIALGGLLLAAAFATKQSFAAFGLPVVLWLAFYRDIRRAAIFLAASTLPALIFLGAMHVASGGWYWIYISEVPRAHPIIASRLWPGTALELWVAFGWAAAAAVLACLAWIVRGARSRPDEGTAWWLLLTVTAIPVTAVLRAHFGSFTNALLPACWVLAGSIVFVLGRTRQRWPQALVTWAVAVVICLQLWTGKWEPARYLPTAEDRTAGEQLIQNLRRLDGTVFIPHAPWYPHLAGKAPSYTVTALWDLQHEGSRLREEPDVVTRAIAAEHWDYIVAPLDEPFGRGLQTHYRLVGRLPTVSGPSLDTRVGWPIRLGELWAAGVEAD